MFVRGRQILLGVGGGISAYKSCELVRRLQDNGFVVSVVPTQSSLNFVGVSTWAALSGKKVYTDLWSDVEEVPHISLAQNCSAIVIAPTTADLLSRLAQGRADDLLTNIVLASTKPKILVPAMHPEMWSNPATVSNVDILRERGFLIIEPDHGRMTGNDVGVGRYPEVSRIIEEINQHLLHNADLLGKKILITAGGTRENIDPVRYIGNRSSGKQGFALAYAAAKRGAQVHLVAANTQLPVIEGITTTFVETAEEMATVVKDEFPLSDVLIMSAAVSDFKVAQSSDHKIHKQEFKPIDIVLNPDIVASVGVIKQSGQLVVGFAAETSAEIEKLQSAGRDKLLAKGLDLIYVNDVSDGKIFGDDQTTGMLIAKSGNVIDVPMISKDTLSEILLDQLLVELG
jgi:phosphopantothenoylcysteine decarboxylase / phosphopantothenate---cysteine ligase